MSDKPAQSAENAYKKEKISEILGSIDDKYLSETLETETGDGAAEGSGPSGKNMPRRLSRKVVWTLAAAALVLIAAGVSAAVAIRTEAKEYNAAVAFFEENDLPLAGLSRAEVREVYRDIISRRFSSDKTAEILRERVAGVEILQEDPSPEELAAAWDKWLIWDTVRTTGISYRKEIRYKVNEETGMEELEASVLSCYRDAECIWTTEITDFWLEKCVYGSAGTIAWGHRYPTTITSSSKVTSWLALLDEEGKILWSIPLRHSYDQEYVGAVLENGDGTIAVVSRGDFKDLCLSQYDLNGKLLGTQRCEIGNWGLTGAVRLPDGYLVSMKRSLDGKMAHLVKVGFDAQPIVSFDYEGEDCSYVINSMVRYGGKIYLSGYSVPIKERDKDQPVQVFERGEIQDIIMRFLGSGKFEVSSEELTPLLRENYTAVLLVLSSDFRSVETFYSVKGSLGTDLTLNSAGALEWDVESITSSVFSPATNAYSIVCHCNVFRYTFDEGGTLLRQDDTGEETSFYR